MYGQLTPRKVVVKFEHIANGVLPLSRAMAVNKFVQVLVLYDLELGESGLGLE